MRNLPFLSRSQAFEKRRGYCHTWGSGGLRHPTDQRDRSVAGVPHNVRG